MSEKESDGKVYRIYKDRDNHINTKINEDGRKAAIQFDNKGNKLNGPLDLEEVDIDEFIASRTPKQMNPYVQLILDQVISPAITYGLEVGTDKFINYLSVKGIPSAKKAIKDFVQNKKLYLSAIKDGLTGKETKASRLLREAEEKKNSISVEVENQNQTEFEKEYHTPEEVEQIVETMKKSVLLTATCIRILTNTIVMDDCSNLEKLEESKKQLEELGTQEVMAQISLMLEEKNRGLLDETSYQVLNAFRQGDLVIDGNQIPMSRYLDENE
ncbi:MAG: hypothetical protein PHT76_02610 [Anaerostipes sp.]|nr:hypothetical protein [Anaerostipes sp.]